MVIANERIPNVNDGSSFENLGKYFSFAMDSKIVQDQIMDEIEKYLLKIGQLPLHSKHKIAIVNRYIVSKVRWRFTIYNFSETWIKQNLAIAINQCLSLVKSEFT